MYRSFFFFQAEDGIRDIGVTGVQTCALPISTDRLGLQRLPRVAGDGGGGPLPPLALLGGGPPRAGVGRAAGWGRGEISVGAASLKKKKSHYSPRPSLTSFCNSVVTVIALVLL